MNSRTLSAAVFAAALFVAASGCKKKVAAAPPPPPPPVEAPPPPPPKAQPPRIDTFVAEPASVERGQSSTLRWSVANATSMTIDQGVGAVQANGTRQVNPGNSTTYTLSASGAGGMDTRSVTVTVNAPPPPPPPRPAAPKVTISSAEVLSREAQDIYFDYDMSDLRADAVRSATANAELLKRIFAQDPGFTVMIEGNCDERGSAEYNLGLGDRRATSLKDFYVQQGLPADKIKTISYGKEKPVCTDANEACYQKNRHDHMAPGQ
ncbi:MAG TPA: OmpA family protein [Bryobacteraceae bacterium]|jgi:peptidoglycan-associated lipoprotein|nr:OmpA family protein [Bryobacteraceae bacterium]